MKDRQPFHPIGSVLRYNGQRCQVFGAYWNGKVDVQYSNGQSAVLTLAQQKRATRIDVNAQPISGPAKTTTPTPEQMGWEVTVVCDAPNTAQ